MLDSFQEPVPLPPWPVPSAYPLILRFVWYALVVARETDWKDDVLTQELECAMEA